MDPEKHQADPRSEPVPGWLDVALALGVALFAVALPLAGWGERRFGTPDDWWHLDIAVGMLAGDPAAWWAALTGRAAADALRPVSASLWALDWALWGADAPAFFRTNALLHGGCAAALYAVGRSWGLRALAAASGAAWFAGTGGVAEWTSFLAARDDQLMVLLVLLLVASWPRLRGSRAGHAVASFGLLLAALAKASGLAVLGLLVLADFVVQPRATRRVGERLRAVAWPALAAFGFLGLHQLVAVDSGWGPGGAGDRGAHWLEVGSYVKQALFGAGFLLPTIGLAAAGVAVAQTRRAGSAALGWVVVALVLPGLWFARVDVAEEGGGRQLILAAAGFGLAVGCGLDALIGRWRGAAAGALVLLCLASGWRFLGGQEAGGPVETAPAMDLLATVQEAAGAKETTRLVLLAQRLDPSVSSMLASRWFEAAVPGIEEATVVVLQGSPQVAWLARTAPYSDGSFERLAVSGGSLMERFPGALVVAELGGPAGCAAVAGEARGGEGDEGDDGDEGDEGPRYVVVPEPGSESVEHGLNGASARTEDLRSAAFGWTAVPAVAGDRARHEPGRGWLLVDGGGPAGPPGPGLLGAGGLYTERLELVPAELCGVRFEASWSAGAELAPAPRALIDPSPALRLSFDAPTVLASAPGPGSRCRERVAWAVGGAEAASGSAAGSGSQSLQLLMQHAPGLRELARTRAVTLSTRSAGRPATVTEISWLGCAESSAPPAGEPSP